MNLQAAADAMGLTITVPANLQKVDLSEFQVSLLQLLTLTHITSASGGAVTIADGADVAEGATTNAPVADNTTVTSATAATGIGLWKRLVNLGIAILSKLPAVGTATAPGVNIVSTQLPAITEVRSTALEVSHVLKASAGQLCSLSVFNSGSAQFILVINSATVPANGAVTLLFPPIPIAAASIVQLDFPRPIVASTGIAVSNSSTGTFTKTGGGSDCAFYAQVN